MKIKCYNPDVLNEDNKKYLLENVEIYGKSKLFIKKIMNFVPYVFIIIFLMFIFFTSQNMSEFQEIASDLLLFLILFLFLTVFLKYLLKLKREINKDFNGVMINLIKEIVFIENNQEKEEFYGKEKNILLDSLKTFYRKNIVLEEEKKMYLQLYNNKYQEGEIIEYLEFEQEKYVLIKIDFRIPLYKLRRRYSFKEYYAIISKEDYNKFKEIEGEYRVRENLF